MSTISFDAQSFIIDSRRTWLVSGAIHYPRVPRELWPARIRAAKQAGLNCIETYVFWNAHEPEPGRFVFEGDLDLRAFVETIGDEGMYCVLRPGPYVCAEWDFGGLPPWLLRTPGMKLREGHPAYLEACSRYLGAVMRQVKDLQVTTPVQGAAPAAPEGNVPGEAAGGFTGAGGGPIVMIQAENEWFSHNPEQREKYLREIVRYLRENGCEVPINNCNNLWQRVEGTIDTWNANRHLLPDLRQLAVVQPEAPRLVTEYWPGWYDTWGQKHEAAISPDLNLYRLAQILAAGAQYNLYMFHGGTNFAFWGSRLGDTADAYQTTSYDYDAPLHEAGGRGEKYATTKRISTLASQFYNVFAHLDPERHPAAVATDEGKHSLSVCHLAGTQGEVVFLLRGENDRAPETDIVLPDGQTLTVPLGDERVAWLMLKTNLGGVAQLDYTNLRPWAFLGRRMLVLFGPKGAQGLVSLDDVQVQINVPTGREPVVEQHDNLVIVVLSTEQVDETYIHRGGLAVGAAGLDEEGEPQPLRGRAQMVLVDLDGNVTPQKTQAPRRPTAPRLTGWEHAPVTDLLDGTSDAYQKIDGPASLEALHQNFGYGWYRIGMGSAKQAKVMAPNAGDRLHFYNNGKLQALIGHGPGAADQPVSLRLSGDLVVLADNLGRHKIGYHFGEAKGLADHLYAVKPARLGKPKTQAERSPDPFALHGFVFAHRRGEQGPADALTWSVKPSGRKPVILDVRDLPVAGMFFVNGAPLDVYDPDHSAGYARYVLQPGERGFTGGTNAIKLALFQPLGKRKIDFDKHLKLYHVTDVLSSRGQWAFAPWGAPGDDAFTKLPSTTPAQPAWYRARFNVSDAGVPLWLEPRGMSKGQVYLNGHNVGRYFVATRDGKALPPQKQYYLPEPWLRTDEPNELVLFDEHGKTPTGCRLVYNPMGPFNK